MANLFMWRSLNIARQCSPLMYQSVRTTTAKHWNPKFKKLRSLKVIRVKLPNFNERYEDLPKEKIRAKMKEKGLLPPRPWNERALYISTTGGVFEPYVPPEGDGKKSSVTPSGAKQKIEFLEKKSKSMMAIRKIKSFDDDFDTDAFCIEAQNIYIRAHESLVTKSRQTMRECITERMYLEFKHNTENTTIRWKFLQSLEPPRVVHARCTDVVTKENIFAQVTVRFHTQQQLAIYDRFGRLMHGSEILAKDVLEYIVFEKHLSNVYGVWRIHDKIIPDWMPPKQPTARTYVMPEEEPEEEVKEQKVESKEVAPAVQETVPQAPLATA